MKYYKTDSRKISFREYWHMAPKGFWQAWLNKIRGIQMNLSRGIPEPQPFKSRIIEAASIPKKILEKLDSGVLDLQKLGFDQFWYCSNKQSLTGGIGYVVVGLHSSRQIIAKAIYVIYKTRERLVIGLHSHFNDGTLLATSNKKREFNPLPKHVVQRKVGAQVEYLLNLHRKKIAELSRRSALQSIPGLEELAAVEDKLLQQLFDDKIKRGVWVEMTDAEVAALRAQPIKAYMVLPR